MNIVRYVARKKSSLYISRSIYAPPNFWNEKSRKIRSDAQIIYRISPSHQKNYAFRFFFYEQCKVDNSKSRPYANIERRLSFNKQFK